MRKQAIANNDESTIFTRRVRKKNVVMTYLYNRVYLSRKFKKLQLKFQDDRIEIV